MVVLKEGDVRPGKCFATQADDKVRRVLSVRTGQVEFEVRLRRRKRVEWSGRAEAPMEEFLAEAAREVGCDY